MIILPLIYLLGLILTFLLAVKVCIALFSPKLRSHTGKHWIGHMVNGNVRPRRVVLTMAKCCRTYPRQDRAARTETGISQYREFRPYKLEK